jgi:pimeloyl-ACP methyl ester carboxylesterase
MDGTGLLFYRQMPELGREFRVATYTLRDSATHMHTLVEDLASIVAQASPSGQRAVVFGESFGGALSMSFALARPELVERLVVLNTFPYFRPQLRLKLAVAWIRTFPWKTMALVRRLTATRMHSRYTHRDEIQHLGEIGVPTLLLAADRDHLVPSVEQASFMAERIPEATLRILKGHGHGCLLAPNLHFARILSEWLGRASDPNQRD